MNTTALGLISAITLMVFHTYLVNKGEKIVKDIEEKSFKLTDLLSTRKIVVKDE
jgi:biopolymer transport protein ExbB/TolQ